MVALIVFDLPLEGPFDYLVPEDLEPRISVGKRVKVAFGPRNKTGFVAGIASQSIVAKLKPVQAVLDEAAVFNELDLNFARQFSAYYGSSLGQALAAMLRNKKELTPSINRPGHKPVFSLFRCGTGHYAEKIREVMDGYRRQSKQAQFLVLVPDSFRADTLSRQLNAGITIGTRSHVFECDGRFDCVFMVDDQDVSYKQEQMPMYETRQVLMERAGIFGFDVAFVGTSPSVELMALARAHKIRLEETDEKLPLPRLIDTSNYKFMPGLVSPPVRDALEASLKSGKRCLLVLNRKGSYRLTRCVECGEVLKCHRCDSPLYYSRADGQYLCRHCTFTSPGDTECPKCRRPSWRSLGIGVEQLQSEIKKIFPQAKIASFQRTAKTNKAKDLGDFDLLIATQAVLRFQGQWQVDTTAFIDFDAELNRLEARSAFNAFSLVLQVSNMTTKHLFIQARNTAHYVLQSLSHGKTDIFYDEELKLRKELGFSPFKHWVQITWRGKSEKSTHQAASEAYNDLISLAPQEITITPLMADVLPRKREQFRFNVMVAADEVTLAVAFIKSTLAKKKRPSRVIVTINVDP